MYDFNDTLPVTKHKLAAEKIKEHYFGSKNISMESMSNLIDVSSSEINKIDN